MSRIGDRFKKGKEQNRALLIPYLTAGFPSMQSSTKLFEALAKEGADILEIGIPFSDPLADGPTIQRSSEIALAQNVTTRDVFELIKHLRGLTDIPLVVMTYYNLFFRYGLEKFVDRAYSAGLDGVIIPDLPPEEASDWLKAAKGKLETIFLLAPTSGTERVRKIAALSEGFVYCVSLTGVTGERSSLPSTLSDFVQRVREETDKPLAVGFGISTREQARDVALLADGVIVGSAFIKAASGSEDLKEQVNGVRKLLHELSPALYR
jgi:tryptophan synthase alpha chain